MSRCENFSERLKTARGKRSQEALAAASGVSRSALANYERGFREPDLVSLRNLCDALDVSADYLIGRTDDAGNRGGVTNTATAEGVGAQAVAGGTIRNGDPATSEILERLAALEAKVAESSTPPRKRR